MLSPPRLAFALEYPIAFGGGVSVLVRELIRQLAGDYRLSLVSPDTPESLAEAGLTDVLEHHLSWAEGRASHARARLLAGQLLSWKCDLVHFHMGGNYGWGNRRPGTSPIPLLHRRGVRCVSTVHLAVELMLGAIAPGSPWWKRAAALPVAWCGRMHAMAATAAEIAVSDHDLSLLRAWYPPLRGRMHRIYHSRLSETEAPAPAAERDKVILHAGHRAHRKGQHILVRAFAEVAPRHPRWRLCLIGPPGDEAFERLLAENAMAGRVEILGSRDDAAERMRRAAIYVQPSLQEALGLALQEALWEGCAAIGTQAGGIPELIAHEQNGLLIPPDDVPAMAAALDRLMSDEALRTKLGAAGRASIRARGNDA